MFAPLIRQTAASSRLLLRTSRRSFLTATSPLHNKDLPYHLVMGLPALSPTMETGALAEWYVQEGDKFIAGDVSKMQRKNYVHLLWGF
jgi:hypothetical protein